MERDVSLLRKDPQCPRISLTQAPTGVNDLSLAYNQNWLYSK